MNLHVGSSFHLLFIADSHPQAITSRVSDAACYFRYEELMETMYEVLRDSNFKKQDPQLSASMTMDLCRADVKFKL